MAVLALKLLVTGMRTCEIEFRPYKSVVTFSGVTEVMKVFHFPYVVIHVAIVSIQNQLLIKHNVAGFVEPVLVSTRLAQG